MKFKPLNILKMLLVLILMVEIKLIFDVQESIFLLVCFLIGLFAIPLNIAPFVPKTEDEP